jgi:hypothetical protein
MLTSFFAALKRLALCLGVLVSSLSAPQFQPCEVLVIDGCGELPVESSSSGWAELCLWRRSDSPLQRVSPESGPAGRLEVPRCAGETDNAPFRGHLLKGHRLDNGLSAPLVT